MPELGVKWKKADFRKGEQSQHVEAKMSSCPGGVHSEMALKPSHHCGFHVASPDGSAGKESTCNAGDTGDAGSIPVLGRSTGGGNGQPAPVFLPEKFHGQRSLVGYSPWGCKELDMTERLRTVSRSILLLPLLLQVPCYLQVKEY